MRKYLRAFFVISFLFMMFFNSSNINILAVKAVDAQSALFPLENNRVTEEKLSDSLTKKETITYFKYKYGDYGNLPYEYVVVRVTVTYADASGASVASGYFESTFMYNSELNLSRCLSTSHGQSCSNDKYTMDLDCRTKNLSMDIGESFGKIRLHKMLLPKDKSIYIFSCDKYGNLSMRVF